MPREHSLPLGSPPARLSGLPVLSAQFPRTSSVCAAAAGAALAAFPGSFLRTSRPALARFASLACCVRSGAPRPPPEGPLRQPPASKLPPVCALLRSVVGSARAVPCARSAAAARSLAGERSRLLLSPVPRFLARFAGSPCLARFAASGPGGSGPGGDSGLWPLFYALAPRALFLAYFVCCGARLRPSGGFPLLAPGRAAARRC